MPDQRVADATMQVLDVVDRPMTQSKKFAIALVGQLSWKLLLFYMVASQQSDAVLLASIAAAGAVETAFLGVQGWHDRLVKSEKLRALRRRSSDSELA